MSTIMAESPLHQQSLLMLRLPRELRDMIYPHIVAETHPIPLSAPNPHAITSPRASHPTIAAEALESFYQTNTFILDFHIIPRHISPLRWGPHPALLPHIRHLHVQTSEPLTYSRHLNYSDAEHWHAQTPDRGRWSKLLDLPRLETLAVYMQKTEEPYFLFQVFSPVIYELRARDPAPDVTFLVSFDDVLEKEWHAPRWAVRENDDYEPMGYTDVTEVFAVPTDEDREFVAKHIRGPRRILGTSVRYGLLDQSPASRRALAKAYVTKDPPLLRVLMERHYQEYKKAREEDIKDAAGSETVS
ncbi:hypothetical protein BDV95DRAFT_594825 [Massariosphaeria phaeospora]|uniref:Uncharacterized protein n=1 Tax=Massariosphaeria phaeospora TaxID=100035 RepID=A0A7C8MP88_9PLEO|nr:hypothetical protein BDV95DRAFT_594825 [Massariosphaeria phaeospora]